jgi:protoporphyrinogen oxidase
MYAARRTGMKRELFGYVPGGYARIIQQFERALEQEGVRCRSGQPVRTIASAKAGQVRIELENGNCEHFNQAVVTTVAPVAAQICPQLSATEKGQLKGIKYQGIICASLLLKERLSDFYITNITDSSIPYTAVIEMSALVDHKSFAGRALVYLPQYVSCDSLEFERTDEEVQERFLGALERMYPQFRRADLLCFQISRVKYLLPIPTLNYSDHLPEISTSIPGVHIVNSAHIVNGTLNVNETVQLAESTAHRLAKQSLMDDLVPEVADHDITETDRQPIAGCRQ